MTAPTSAHPLIQRNGTGLACAVLALLCAAAGHAHAARFEEVPGRAWLGQPLDFPLRLRLDAGQALEPQCLKAEVIVGERNAVAARVRHQRTAPGEYLLRVQGNDESGEGGGGFQCCWTNTYVKVTVK